MTEQPGHQPEAPQAGPTDREAPLAATAQPKTALRRVWRIVWRILVAIVGSVVILAGIGISIPGVPGPGFVVILAGLAILATEFAAPRRLLQWLREWVRKKTRRAQDQPVEPES